MTIKDIARESGYSVGTVSRVLNNHPDVSEKARQTITEVVDRYHFRLNSNAKLLKQQNASGIAIIIKGSQNMFFPLLLEPMQRLVEQNGYSCQLYYIDEKDNEVEHALQICRERHPLGLLFLGSSLNNFQTRFSEITIPCVLVSNSAKSLAYANLSSVSTDDATAAEAAVTHLIRKGHRRIGVLGGWKDWSHAAKIRYQGCLRAFETQGIPFSEKEQYECALFSISEGYDAMNRLMDKMPDLTAVFAMSDVMAVGAIRAVCDKGLRVPDDVSVIGFDGIEFGNYMTPRLATIRQNREEIADRSVNILLQRIQNEELEAVHETVPFRIIPGESIKEKSGSSSDGSALC